MKESNVTREGLQMSATTYLKENGINDGERKIHKKCLTCLEINVPVAYKDNFIQHVVNEVSTPLATVYICKHTKLFNFKKVYDELIENFEREVCDIIRISTPDCFYLIVTQILNPGMKRSDKYRYIGFVSCNLGTIQTVWIHPFYRDIGLMKHFLVWYGTHENPLIIQPPVRKRFNLVVQKANQIIAETPELLKKNLQLKRKFFKKHSPNAQIDLLTDANLSEVMRGISIFSAMYAKENKDVFSIDIAISGLTETCIFLNNNPEQKENLQKYYENNPDLVENNE